MSRPLLSALLLVKDEAASVEGVVSAVLPYAEGVTVLDTGSTDGTQDLVRRVANRETDILREGTWEGYAQSRNRLMQLDRELRGDQSAVFQLMLSADEYVRNGERLREQLEAQRESDVDLFRVRVVIDDDTTMMRPIVFRTGSVWRYVDADCGVHEFPAHPDPQAKIVDLDGVHIDHVVSDPERRVATVWEVHVPLLKEALARNPDNARALTFLVQSYGELLGYSGFDEEERVDIALQASWLCDRRLQLPGHPVELNYIRYCRLKMAYLGGFFDSDRDALAATEALKEADPERPEIAFMRLELLLKVQGVTANQVFEAALEAARVAQLARGINNSSPVRQSLVWRSFRTAAVAARQLMQGHPDEAAREVWRSRCAMALEAGRAAGGPEQAFEGILDDVVPAPADFESAAPPPDNAA